MDTGAALQFRAYSVAKLREYESQLIRCARLLTQEELWRRPNEHSNAAGNLIIHLTGNVRQWIVAGLGREAFDRHRQAEFDQRDPLPADQIVAALSDVLDRACAVITGLSDECLSAAVSIQGYHTTVVAAVYHVVEHFAFHTGQVIWLTKAMRDVDLSLYDSGGQRLDGRAGGAP